MTNPSADDDQRQIRKGHKSNHRHPQGRHQNDNDRRSRQPEPQPLPSHQTKRRRARSARTNECTDNSDLVQDIEEQLRRQRLKKQEQEEVGSMNNDGDNDPKTSSSLAHRPKRVLGNYEYERQAYFPKSAQTRPNSSKIAEEPSKDLEMMDSLFRQRLSRCLTQASRNRDAAIRLPSILCALQSCSDLSIRRQLQSLCVGRCLRDSMEIVPNTIACTQGDACNLDKERWLTWLDPHPHTEPPATLTGDASRQRHPHEHDFSSPFTSHAELTIPPELMIKTQLHPSARTFDVMDNYPNQPGVLPTMASVSPSGVLYAPSRRQRLLDLDSNEDDDLFRAQPTGLLGVSHARDWKGWNIQMVRAFHDNNKQIGFLSLVEKGDAKAVRFHRHHGDAESTHTMEQQIAALWLYPGPIHDVSYLPFSNRLVCAPGRRTDSKPLRPCCVDVGQLIPQQQNDFHSNPRTSSASWSTSRFPQSDALCLEPDPANPNVVIYGHRNGQVSLVDIRTARECEVTTLTPCNKQTMSVFGSTNRLLVPKYNPYFILARGSMGATRLYDVRRCAAGRTSRNGDHVIEFGIPANCVHATLTSRSCNGLALDPTGEVIIAPYINHMEEPYFGLWSLRSGQLVASKRISVSRGDQQQSWPNNLPYVELCSTPTKGWRWSDRIDDSNLVDSQLAEAGPDRMQITQPKGRWGLWFLFGQPLVRRAIGSSLPPPRTSVIHHISFDGRT